MSAAPIAKGIGPRSIDLRDEYQKRQEAMRRRALDTRSIDPGVARQPTDMTKPVEPVHASEVTATSAPRATKRRFTRIFGLHIASLGILAGLAAVLIIIYLPSMHAKILAPITNRVSASGAPKLAKPTGQSVLAKAVTAPAKPTDRLVIPSINVNASVTEVGLTKANALDAPKTLWQVAHYTDSPEPGDVGTSIIDGHSGAPGQYGVLEALPKLAVGSIITYHYVNGANVSFKVTTSKAYPEVQATADRLFAETTTPTLNIISCYGKWNAKTDDYDQRWLVTAELVQ